MALLSAHKLTKSFGGRTLFSEISFEIAPKDRIGLVGANGTGKTTLLQILLGLKQADEGEVHRAKLLRIATLEQSPAVLPGQSLYHFVLQVFARLMEIEKQLDAVNQALSTDDGDLSALINKQHQLQEEYERKGGLTYRNRTRSTLLGLGFSKTELGESVAKLSGGQLNKAMLSQVLLSDAEMLFLDEPTNHLDMQAVAWLESYLKAYAGAYIIVSHDRYFLDQVTNRTMELNHEKLYISSGNYSAHTLLRSTEQEIAQRHYYNTQREIRRIYGIVEQQRRWNRERNIKTAESKLKQIERLKKTLVEPEQEQQGIRFSFQVKEPGGNDALIASKLKKAYGENLLFHDADLHIRAGERVFLLGPNGCGKTTLLRILMGRETADEGISYFGAGVEPAYYEQNMRSMHEENTALQEVWSAYPRMRQTQVRNALASFLFRGDEVEKKIHMLSGGEKARVQLLKLMLSGSNLLLLDEPTNHLDIASRETLEAALEAYAGALLIVTHDRYLVNRIADRVIYMQEDKLVETIGGYDAFLEASNARKEQVQPQTLEKPKSDYQERKERQSALVRAKSAIKNAERGIEEAEADIAQIETMLIQPDIVTDYIKAGELAQKLDEARARLDICYQDWEEAEDALAALTAEDECV